MHTEAGKGKMVPFNEHFIQCKILYEMGVYLQCQYAICPFSLDIAGEAEEETEREQ